MSVIIVIMFMTFVNKNEPCVAFSIEHLDTNSMFSTETATQGLLLLNTLHFQCFSCESHLFYAKIRNLQIRVSHQCLIHFPCSTASFRYGPHHQELSAVHVSGRKDLRPGRRM